MRWGTFTSSNSVLLLIDHQVGTMKLIQNIPFETAKRNTLALTKAAKILGMPIILTTGTENGFQGPLLPEFKELVPEAYDARIARSGVVNTWEDPEFRAAVEKTQRSHLIMAGVTTDVCLYSPALSAVEDGYPVQAVLDASGSPTELSEQLARQRMERGGVTLTATNTLIAELARDWSRPEGSELLKLMVDDVLPPVF
ncbi:isochorismatase family protein [Halomonas sp. DP8Y7-1]|uniref:isochorismatase family protein n=1 Tax=Halomonas sp. DP8Y7-1 TaxID=2859078 RepID=UPI001C9603F2|nr:isochorismatase family protein [Halomonas sp. DP8Y7-1]MBY6028124.1 isochorismatase family protein [Halomonas sp. DP8Y7-1]